MTGTDVCREGHLTGVECREGHLTGNQRPEWAPRSGSEGVHEGFLGRHLPADRSGRGPLGALPRLSGAARRALSLLAVLTALQASALVVQAVALCSVLAEVVTTGGGTFGGRLAVAAGAVLARALLGWAVDVVAARAAAGAKEELRGQVLDASVELGPEWIAARGPAELSTLCTKGLDALDGYFTKYLPALVTCAVVPLAVGVVILFADWVSAALILFTVPLLPLFAVLVGKYTADRVRQAADGTERLSGHLLELVRALPVLTGFRRASAQAAVVRRVSDRHRRATMANLRVAFSSAFVLELAATLSVALVAVGIGIRLVSGDLTLAVGLTVLVLAPECYLPLRAAGAAHHASEDGVEAVRRVSEVLAERDALASPQRARRHSGQRQGAGGAVDFSERHVRVRGLRVDRRSGPAPDGVSFDVRPGEIHLLDSPSGAGKSTTFAVLLGFVRPGAGRVEIGDVDMSAMDLSTWRRNIAWVPQRPAFAGGTVRGELELALADREAPSAAELDEVIARVNLGAAVDRRVAELSVGERQRLAVARALLRVRHGAWLLLLDEPTAHLDVANADAVRSAVRDAARDGAAVLMAAHRAGVSGSDRRTAAATSGGAVRATSDAPPVAAPVRAPRLRVFDRRLLRGTALGAAALLCGIALTATSAWLIAKASEQPPILTLSVAVVAVRTFGLAKAVLRYFERLATHDAAFRIAGRLRERLWDALVQLGPAWTLGLRGGEGMRRLTDDVDTVRDLTPRVLVPPSVVAAVCAVAVAVQAIVLPPAGLALGIAVLLAAVAAPAFALLADRRASTVLDRGRIRVSNGTFGLLDASAELIAFGAHRQRRAELAAEDAQLARLASRQAFGAGVATMIITGATGAAAVAGAALAAIAVTNGTLVPVLAPLPALLPLALAEVLALLPPAAQQYGALRAAASRVSEVLHTPGERSRPAETGREVSLNDVDVRWPGAAEPALREVNLHIPRGAHVAIVGPSGAGKSTLLALLLGFLRPEAGSAVLPERVAWCPQDAQLVSTTIRENLRLGAPEATDDELTSALSRAGLAGWSLDVRVGTGGTALSGGEAGRLALARALLAAPGADVVLLDEPTAQLDVPTARGVLDGLRDDLAGQTVLHVTHRAEEAADADMLVEVQRGRAQVILAPREPAAV
ncbi:MAG: thiol reductant ABC exporter subunit CydD [Pseudonocardiaceae bacterium]|nr:thiol reductant ABC exporter subunit CydD [Pseudonocardiaceae bacterium]